MTESGRRVPPLPSSIRWRQVRRSHRRLKESYWGLSERRLCRSTGGTRRSLRRWRAIAPGRHRRPGSSFRRSGHRLRRQSGPGVDRPPRQSVPGLARPPRRPSRRIHRRPLSSETMPTAPPPSIVFLTTAKRSRRWASPSIRKPVG